MTADNTSILQLQLSALEYLDQTGGLDGVKEQANKYRTSQEKAFQFLVIIDPADLLDMNADLGNLVLNHPGAAAKIFQQVVFTVIGSLDLLPKCINISQIVVLLQLVDLPEFPKYQIQSGRGGLQCAKQKRFMKLAGVVCGITTLTKYTKCAKYVCPDENCPGSQGNKYIRLHIPGAREAQTIRGDFKCNECGETLKEDISARVLGDKLVLEVIEENAFHHQINPSFKDKGRAQCIAAYVRDDLVTTGIHIGQKIGLIGIPIIDMHQRKIIFEVNNVLNFQRKEEVLHSIPNPEIPLPLSINQLYQDRKSSPWSFTLSIAYAFAANIVPAGTFLHLKLEMLLALVSCGQMEKTGSRACLDLLAVGEDTLLLGRLLCYGASFCGRVVNHCSSQDLLASVSKDRYGSGTCFIEGGSLLLADRGICLLGDITAMKKNMKEPLQKALEQGSIIVDVPQKISNQPAHQTTLPLHCSVWAHMAPTTVKGATNKEELVQTVCLTKDAQSLVDMFGLVSFVNTGPDTYADSLVTNHILAESIGIQTHQLIPEEELRVLLCKAREINTTLSHKASKLLQGYYVASRRMRADSAAGTSFPVTSLQTITSLTLAHAKLRLESEASEEDAVLAVYLYEEACTLQHGYSVLSVLPMPHVLDHNIQAYIGQERDEKLRQFQQQLKHICSSYAAEEDPLSTDGSTDWPEE